MTHGYSLRPNTKGRQKHNQVEGASTGRTSKGGHEALTGTDELLEGESGSVDPRPANPSPDTPTGRAAHNPPGHSRKPVTSSVISASTTTRYRIEGRPQPETREEIQAARKREESRRSADAVRIQREQIARGYREEMRALRARIGALRRECEVEVREVRRRWRRAWAIERGEVLVVVEDGEEGDLVGLDEDEDEDLVEDVDGGEMAIDKNFTPTETSSLATGNGDDHQQRPGQWSSRSLPYRSRSESKNFSPPLRKTQRQQQQDDDGRGPRPGETHTITGRRLVLPRNHPPPTTRSQGQGQGQGRHSPSRPPPSMPPSLHSPQPQPLRRQPAQLIVIPSDTSSHGSLSGLHTYGTAVVDPEIRFGGTDGDGDNDSEMDG